ncbi:MAG: hypothetical protein GTO40_30200 [Deltaproteobacteria bacterium]|nr:hypothetical protein [Deltaproteobacteria bacterium]
MRFEWRYRGEDRDALLAIEEDGGTVLEARKADAALLKDFLNEMTGLDTPKDRGKLDESQRDPRQWGDLVMARSESGDVLSVEPELYWDRIKYWFRSRGEDPHPWRKRNPT